MSAFKFKYEGFTLIEIAIVLLIVAILLGYTLAMFPVQQELKRYRQADQEMDKINEQLIAFAQVNGRLPCPDDDDDGEEDFAVAGDECSSWFGNLPSRTMGYYGNINSNGVLIDPWGEAYRYQVSRLDDDTNGIFDFINADELRETGIQNLNGGPNLLICNTNPAAHSAATPNADNACDANTEVVDNAVTVILSLGKDMGNVGSDIQSENWDTNDASFVPPAFDNVFVYTSRNESSGSEYDDIVKWIPTNLLFSKMIEADQLP